MFITDDDIRIVYLCSMKQFFFYFFVFPLLFWFPISPALIFARTFSGCGFLFLRSTYPGAQPKDGRLAKDGSLYRIADKNEAADLLSVGDRSAASDLQPMHDREAGQGGGG